MHRSKVEIYLHYVWATHHRLPLLVAAVEGGVYACIVEEVHRVGGEVLALGGMPDHVHLAVRLPADVAPSRLMQRVKGVSSTLARRRLVEPGGFFGWQDGYGVFSFSRSHLRRVVGYIENQRAHHAAGRLWPAWEAYAEEQR